MKKLLLWAVLCTACTSFAMDQISFEQFPASPGKALSEEDLKSLLSVTQANSPEEPRSASSSPIPLDPSQEQSADYSNATEELRNISLHSQDTTVLVSKSPSPEPVKSVADFQNHFKQWILAENIKAFRGFLREHYSDAEEYISSEIVELARQKKESTPSDVACEIHSLLSHLKSGKDNHFGDMEKKWHHTFSDGTKESRQSNGNFCEAEILVVDYRDCGPLPTDHYESESKLRTPTFFQQKTSLNIVLRDLIRHQKFDEISNLVCELTKYDNCNLAEVISDKTIDFAFEKTNSNQSIISKMLYSTISEQADDISAGESDATAESLERVFTTNLDKIKLSKKGERAMVKSKLLTCIENIDFKGLNKLCDTYECEAQIAKYINQEILKTAEIMRDRVAEVYELVDPETGHNAREVWLKLYQVVHAPLPVVYILSDEEETGPVYSEGQLDRQRIVERVKNAFSLSTVESIVGSAKTEKILQLLEQEKKSKKQDEFYSVSPQSSPSEGLREYLGSFKSESLSD